VQPDGRQNRLRFLHDLAHAGEITHIANDMAHPGGDAELFEQGRLRRGRKGEPGHIRAQLQQPFGQPRAFKSSVTSDSTRLPQ